MRIRKWLRRPVRRRSHGVALVDEHAAAAEQLAITGGTSVSAAKNMLETSKQVKKLPKKPKGPKP